ncbi:MAG TPA: head-tail connector protein [Caulobacteraceae bacterium]|nr:head-tail connector protein [Caulobacteraceae bacterium]
MADAVSLAEAKAFLRVTDDAEEGLIGLLIDAAQARVEVTTGLTLDETSAAPLRLAVLMLVAQGFEHREQAEAPVGLVEPWIAPYRTVRLT